MSPPPIPEGGLAEVLRHWIGRGSIWEVLAVPAGNTLEQAWTARDLENRAHRVLLERVVPFVRRWPVNVQRWVDLLPASRQQSRAVRSVPFSGVDWPTTRIRHGWPATAFAGREQERRADMVPATTFRWVIDQLTPVREHAIRVFPDVDLDVRRQLDAAEAMLNIEPIASASALEPGRPEVLALRREGSPWGAIADVAEELRQIQHSRHHLVSCLLMPDDGIRWRLFHLAVLGEVLTALRDLACTVVSIRPLGGSAAGPCYIVTDTEGEEWELWFEASSVWSHAEIASPYVEASCGLPALNRPLGADLLLLRRGITALVIECKYSANQETVGRDGYLQAMTYANEIRSRLATAVTAIVVGPEGVVSRRGSAQFVTGEVGFSPPSAIAEIVREFVAPRSVVTMQ